MAESNKTCSSIQFGLTGEVYQIKDNIAREKIAQLELLIAQLQAQIANGNVSTGGGQ